MEMEWTVGIARLIAASGMTAITHSNRDAEPDAHALIAHLSAMTSRVGVWATSAHGPAGQDENPGLNAALDAFAARALADDRPLTLVNNAGARHSYELWLDTQETHRILQQGLDFLRAHLR